MDIVDCKGAIQEAVVLPMLSLSGGMLLYRSTVILYCFYLRIRVLKARCFTHLGKYQEALTSIEHIDVLLDPFMKSRMKRVEPLPF